MEDDKLRKDTSPLEEFMISRKREEKEEKAQEVFDKMLNECDQHRDQAIAKSKQAIKVAQEIIEAFYLVVGYIEEKEYQSAYHQWNHIEEELIRTMNAHRTEFYQMSETALQKYLHLKSLAKFVIRDDQVINEVKRTLDNAANEMDMVIQEVMTRKHHYEETENIKRYWAGG